VTSYFILDDARIDQKSASANRWCGTCNFQLQQQNDVAVARRSPEDVFGFRRFQRPVLGSPPVGQNQADLPAIGRVLYSGAVAEVEIKFAILRVVLAEHAVKIDLNRPDPFTVSALARSSASNRARTASRLNSLADLNAGSSLARSRNGGSVPARKNCRKYRSVPVGFWSNDADSTPAAKPATPSRHTANSQPSFCRFWLICTHVQTATS